MRQKIYLFSALTILLIGAALITTSQWTDASSHREAPIISTDPVADNTDVYAFRPADDPGNICIIACYNPLEEPAGGPNFHKFGTDVLYEIKIDNIGDRIDHISYQFVFSDAIGNGNTFLYNTGDVTSLSDPDLNVKQTYVVKRVVDGVTQWTSSPLPVPPCYVGGNSHSDPNYAGPSSMSNYSALMNEAVKDLPSGGGKVFCGPTDDPFFVDLGAAFDLLKIRPGAPGNAGGGKDALAGFNVHSICIKVPIAQVTRNGSSAPPATDSNAIVGVWATASRKTTTVINNDGTRTGTGSWVYVSRLGMPLVNEVVLPLSQKDKWNASIPVNDAQFLNYVTNPELAGIINALYPITDDIPTSGRTDLVAVFLTGVATLNQRPQDTRTPSEQIRLNLGIAPVPFASENRLGVIAGDAAGFPNGRRLKDDVVDIALRVVGGVLLGPPYSTGVNSQLGDAVQVNDKAFMTSFPYLAIPSEGYVDSHGLTMSDPPLPVELTAFTSTIIGRNVSLNWTTNNESNNSGFDIEKTLSGLEWVKIGFVEGVGNSNTTHSYSFTDRKLTSGTYKYRLKQIDFNGNFKYLNLLNEVVIGIPSKFELSQNYPNPFNPVTKIDYSIPADGKVSLVIYDALGREIKKLVNSDITAGYYSVDFDASQFSSGVYYYKLDMSGQNNFSDTKKMLLVK